MKRLLALGTLAAGSLSIVLAAFQAPPDAPSASALAATKIERVKDNLYVITGEIGGDSFSGGNSDHTGNNDAFGTMVSSVVQEKTRANMARMDAFKGEKAAFLPKRTFKDKLTLGAGKDEIDLYYFGAGHTNGDAFVVFPALRTMHAGDMFASKALPYVDASNGGSVLAHPQTLAKAVATIKDVDTVIPGHMAVATWNDLKEYADFMQDFTTFVRREMAAHKTVDQAAADFKVPARYKGYAAGGNPQFGGTKGLVQIAYDELKK